MAPAVRKTISSEEIGSNSLFKVIDPERIRAECVDEGIFPDEILEAIESRRKQILAKMEEFVLKNRTKCLESHEVSAGIEEIKTTIRVILLEIEKLQAQTGTSCIKECDRMLGELESIHDKIKNEKRKLRIFYQVAGVILLGLLGVVLKKMYEEGNVLYW